MTGIDKIFEEYIHSISSKFSYTETSEMGYRSDFEVLLKHIFESIKVSRFDHDAKAKDGNKPDFVLINDDVPLLYIETKDIGVSLDKVERSEQMARYYGYANLVLTDYLEFRFYRNGLAYGEPIKIADFDLKTRIVTSHDDNYELLERTLLDFAQSHKEPIKSGKHLAKIMGGKGQRIRDNIREFMSDDADKNVVLVQVYETFRKLLVHDLSISDFSDMYAQTLVYGLFVARYYDETPGDFTRGEARDLVPKSNPLLQRFFDHIVGPDFDKRIENIVDELCVVFSHSDVNKLMNEYLERNLKGKTHRQKDTVIHFYEDFLSEYDENLRKRMGAYYTPLPVVQYIVRSVDEILKKDFALHDGLADSSKSPSGLHKVQVLDPAVGTGTFISEVIGQIYRTFPKGQSGRWYKYVHNDLLPRIHGFELMMAPYTIAHLKLGMAFAETGFKHFNNRLGIYLTNSLEDSFGQADMFSQMGLEGSIAEESKEAQVIKTTTPVMVVLGNPPYSVSSSNKGEWITDLIKDYKKDLNERNIQPLSDDYIKFIRLAEHFVERTGQGVVAMITNNSFLDGIIHRQMRKHLLETFDDIYILDLHGNSKKKEKTPDGAKDENVFDIQQGVSINIFVKSENRKKALATVHHADLYGKRIDKFDSLNKSRLTGVKWQELKYSEPYYFFAPKDFRLIKKYENGFLVQNTFKKGSMGIATGKDKDLVSFTSRDLENQYSLETNEFYYRPFDLRYTIFDKKILQRARYGVMINYVSGNNIGMNVVRQSKNKGVEVLVANKISNRDLVTNHTYNYPLYLYREDGSKTSNLNEKIVDEITKVTGKVLPEDIFDYIYAVLHSPTYREKYKEFLKIDFPRVPYPKDKVSFRKLVKFGTELRSLHLLESPILNKFVTTYPASGSDIVEKVMYKDGNVYINDDQYFGKVSEIAWNFYIGGYQPAKKWLKDRKGRALTNSDLEHYQKMIVVLSETDRIMRQIDKI